MQTGKDEENRSQWHNRWQRWSDKGLHCSPWEHFRHFIRLFPVVYIPKSRIIKSTFAAFHHLEKMDSKTHMRNFVWTPFEICCFKISCRLQCYTLRSWFWKFNWKLHLTRDCIHRWISRGNVFVENSKYKQSRNIVHVVLQ